MKKPKIIMRNGLWYIRRRVPSRYEHVERRSIVQICLFTDSKEMAEHKAAQVWTEMLEAWEAKLEGKIALSTERMAAARNLAQRLGYRYMSADDVAHLPTNELIERIEAVVDGKGRIDHQEAEALLGGVSKPTIYVSESLDEFYRVEAGRLVGKSPDQMRRHRAPRLKAIKNFISVIGDRPIHEITTRDMFDFRAWWLERIAAGEVTKNSANKDFSYLLAMWRACARAHDLELPFKTDGLAFPEGKQATRPPFSVKWIKDKLLYPGALNGLNLQARTILMVMINTGARPSEIAALSEERIVLDAPIPFIRIAAEGRTLKSEYADRDIPLVGVSLDAIKKCKKGFPTYADSPVLSDTVNKFLKENGLRETPGHSLYSLRHSFESRMMKADFPERLKADLMGHRLKRERYGELELAHVRDWLLKIAI
ncbi:tyrosine-type recombinase/integrase [Paracoccus sp. Z330]|uniref:Tyrosine-type recombinase/integrase n=1 Tax=Paracoccus onchidii TaxID=3017813 RepID=A0ABT4ZI16_9RHOB|nr:tyrosine-type recombinase/integrase [Paracoccus onchidii]MDB6178956.1 tyrosine-type recombinase/integrase [Paracoccus onchidii]